MLEEAARRYGAQVELHWHPYELRPEPVPLPAPDSEYIQEHWRNRVMPMAEARGLTMRVPRRAIRSRRALQAALFARAEGQFAAFDRALFRARFEEDRDISDLDELRALAAGVGLDPDATAYAITSGSYLAELNAELTAAAQMGIRGVPIVLVGPASADFSDFLMHAEPVMGAVPFEQLDDAITRARRRAATA